MKKTPKKKKKTPKRKYPGIKQDPETGQFLKGTAPGPGRPKSNDKIVRLADEAAEQLLTDDLKILKKKPVGKGGRSRLERAKERVAKMVRGRVPTRIAIAGDESGAPVPFTYVNVGEASPRPSSEDAEAAG